MRLKALILLSTLSAAAAPAFAQDYSRNCRQAQSDNQLGGLIVGSIIGGVLGSNVAASGHRDDGTAVGAVLGGLVGSGIGRDSVDCYSQRYAPGSTINPNPNYGGPSYYQQGYTDYSYPSPYDRADLYRAPSRIAAYPPAPAYDPPAYDYDRYRSDPTVRRSRQNDLYGRYDRSYRPNDDYAGEDCSEAVQITRLPDGSEVRRPVEVCREARFGDWQVKD